MVTKIRLAITISILVIAVLIFSLYFSKVKGDTLNTPYFSVVSPIFFLLPFLLSLLIAHSFTNPLKQLRGLLNQIAEGGIQGGLIKKRFKGDFLVLANLADKIWDELKKKRGELEKNKEDIHTLLMGVVKSLVNTVEAKDLYTRGHSERVRKYALSIAKRIIHGSDELSLETLEYAAILHDIGKIGISEAILHKPGRLTENEFAVIQTHSAIGANIIEPISLLKDAALIVRHHHERWDGGGYPAGFREEGIPLGSRIIAIADTFDAMTSNRPYRKALSEEVALNEIIKNKGKQFDPELAHIFVRIYKERVRREEYEVVA